MQACYLLPLPEGGDTANQPGNALLLFNLFAPVFHVWQLL